LIAQAVLGKIHARIQKNREELNQKLQQTISLKEFTNASIKVEDQTEESPYRDKHEDRAFYRLKTLDDMVSPALGRNLSSLSKGSQ